MVWGSLLTDAQRREVRAVSMTLLGELRQVSPDTRSHTLSEGAAGLALVCEVADQNNLGSFETEGDAFLSRAVEDVAEYPILPGLWQGYSGVCWVLDRFNNDGGESSGAIVDRYHKDITAQCERRAYDLYGGLAGDGLALLERTPSPDLERLLLRIVTALQALSTESEAGRHWVTSPDHLSIAGRKHSPTGFIATGMAHGSAGIISFLSQTIKLYPSITAAKELLQASTAWLLSQRNPKNKTRYPHTITKTERREGRSAWCHGDIGVAVALLMASQVLGNSSWEAEAVDTARSAFRNNGIDRRLPDLCLCHGASGVAQLYAFMAEVTRDKECALAAASWHEHVLREYAKSAQGLHFYTASINDEGEEVPQWTQDRSLLFGSERWTPLSGPIS